MKHDGTPAHLRGVCTRGAHPVADGSPFTVVVLVAWHINPATYLDHATP